MIKKTLKRLKRAPIPAIAVLLFAAVVSVIVCTLHASNEAELRNYEDAYRSVPVTVTVSALEREDGRKTVLQPWIPDLFTGRSPVEMVDVSAAKDYAEQSELLNQTEPTQVSLAEYVKDVNIRISQRIYTVNGKNFTSAAGTCMLVGLTSLSSDKQLLPEYGCEIKWYEGYDESIFYGEELVCLIPEGKATTRYYDNGSGEAELYFFQRLMQSVNGGPSVEVSRDEYNCTLKIVGTYTAGDELSIYCPYPIVEQVFNELNRSMPIDSISATVADNMRLEEFREKASFFFTDPTQNAGVVPWGVYLFNRSNSYRHSFHDSAIDIADENLLDMSAILKDSIKFNRTVTLIVVALSVVSGFLVGFLMIRRRKRDIILMRTVGESNLRLYLGFAFEQMICIILGVVIGGAYNMWKPIDKLLIFAIVYFVALSLALVIFMSKKLLTTVKEDE